jgi:hypothetical protein
VAIHPGMVEDLALGTRDLYAQAEQRLLGIIARQLADGLDAPGWAERKLSAVQSLRRASQGVVDELGKAVSLEVFDVVAQAFNVGHRAGVAELGALSDHGRRLVDDVTPNAQAVDRLAQETVDLLTERHRSILRTVDDRYRAIVSEVTATPLLGTGTRRQATQDAMQRFADDGIRSFTDRAGRRWKLTSYAEMAVRTSVGRAATEAHARTLTDAGVDLVIVSDAPRECPLCRPWERKVLSLTGGGARQIMVEHATDDGRMVPVDVAGSLDEARRAGLQHPNCRHSVSAYTPGITRVEPAQSDPEGYEAGQRQRAIERNIRRHKNRAAAAVTPEAKQAANAKVRQWQGKMREHLAQHPDLRRNPKREQPGASNLPAPRQPIPDEAQQAARIRSGDHLTPREMSDDQLAAAMRHGDLTERDRVRIAAEADRRDAAALLDRAKPNGRALDSATASSAGSSTTSTPTTPYASPERWTAATSPPGCPASAPTWSASPTTSSPHASATPSPTTSTTSTSSPPRRTAATCSPGASPRAASPTTSQPLATTSLHGACSTPSPARYSVSHGRWTAATRSTSPRRPRPATPSPTCSPTVTPSPRPWLPPPIRTGGAPSPTTPHSPRSSPTR